MKIFLILFIIFFSGFIKADGCIVNIKGTINSGIANYIKRCCKEAENKKYDVFIVKINSPGGLVDSAEKISLELFKLHKKNIKTVAFIEKRALSAAALIAISCEDIYMQSFSKIGDAEPREKINVFPEKVPEKLLTNVRALFRVSAQSFNRNEKIAEAMVDKNIEIKNITKKGQLLTFTAKEAIKNGFCNKILAKIEDLNTIYNLKKVTIINEKPFDNIAKFLTDPIIMGMLLSFGFWAIIAEFFLLQGWSGFIGIVFFSLFFFGKWISGLAGLEHIIIFLIGLILLAMELVVLPGFGVCGIAGLIFIIIPIFKVFNSFEEAINSISIAVLTSLGFGYLIYKYFPNTGIWKKMVLNEKMEIHINDDDNRNDLNGKEAVTVTPLQPLGYIILEDKKYSAKAVEGFIENHANVIIKKVLSDTFLVSKKNDQEEK